MKSTMSLRSVVCGLLAVVLLCSAGAAGQPPPPPKDPKLEAAEKEIVKLRAELVKAKTDLAAREKALADSIRVAEADKAAARKAAADAATARKQAEAEKAAARKTVADAVAAARQTLQKQFEAEKVLTRAALTKVEAATKQAAFVRGEAAVLAAALKQEVIRGQAAKQALAEAVATLAAATGATRRREGPHPGRRQGTGVRAPATLTLAGGTGRHTEKTGRRRRKPTTRAPGFLSRAGPALSSRCRRPTRNCTSMADSTSLRGGMWYASS